LVEAKIQKIGPYSGYSLALAQFEENLVADLIEVQPEQRFE